MFQGDAAQGRGDMELTIPNLLTLSRLIAAPLIALAFVLVTSPFADMIAFIVFVVAALTDFLDGYLARKWDQLSEIGRILDPIADKIMVVIGLGVLMGVHGLTPWLVLPATVILFREVFVSGLREALGDRATALKVTGLAKWKTTFQMFAIAALFLAGALTATIVESMGLALLWMAAILTAMTGWDYTTKATRLIASQGGRS